MKFATDDLEREFADEEPRTAKSANGRAHDDATIGQGQRNAWLTSQGGKLRRTGLDFAALHAALRALNAERCRPPLAESEVEAIARSLLRYAPAGEHEESETADASAFFDERGLRVAKLAAVIDGEGRLRPALDGRLYRYERGVYRPDGDAFVAARVRELLGGRFRKRCIDEVLAWHRAQFGCVADTPTDDRINVANGLLDPRTLELIPHTPEFFSVNQIPVEWHPDARCDAVLRFLHEVLPEDAVEFVLELVGLALYSANPFRVAVLLLGSGANGKSALLRLVIALLGQRNVSAVPLQLLTENRFAAAELFGKLANICGDLDARAIKQSDTFKMITGGDPIIAERKHRDVFTFTPRALPIFSANEAPLSSDQSQAWFDRWLIVPMDRRIPEDRQDPRLAEKLTAPAELEGLLVLAVHGLRRLLDRGRFERPESVRRAGERYRERLDTVRGFVAEGCVLDPEAWVARPELYRRYRAWCQDGGRFPVSAVSFNDHVRGGFAGQVEERIRRGTRGFAGIGLRAEGHEA